MRAANMRRNQEIMRALGLDHSDFQLHKEHKTASAAGGKKSAPAAPVALQIELGWVVPLASAPSVLTCGRTSLTLIGWVAEMTSSIPL